MPPLLLHGHLDVVPAEAADWRFPPFSGEIEDGYVHGRGAVDMKDFDAMILSVLRARAAGRRGRRPADRAGVHRRRGGRRARRREQLVDEHRDLLADCTEAVGEVGGFSATVRGQRLYLIEAAEKGMAWMRLTATAPPATARCATPTTRSPGSPPRSPGSARTSGRCAPTPSMQVLLAAVGELAAPRRRRRTPMRSSRSSARPPGCSAPVIRNTTNPSMLQAGYKVNVVPGEATAQVDGRFLPGHEDKFLDTVADLSARTSRWSS